MRKFLWMNPVSSALYRGPQLEKQLAEKGFELVDFRQDHIGAVKEKYHTAIAKTGACLADMRCPKAVRYIKEKYAPDFLEYPDIEPILLHCARELQQELSGRGFLYITTPCRALGELGDSLGLPQVSFCTWAEFARQEKLSLPERNLAESPIPPGFFAEYGRWAEVLDGREKIDRFFSRPLKQEKKVLELLYCSCGCHHGDGV